MGTKRCKQCGEIKPLTQFRRYYGGRKGTYTMCKDCERINARKKYLDKKGACRSEQEDAELDKIVKLYEVQRAAGLKPPGNAPYTSLVSNLDDLIGKYNKQLEESSSVGYATPAEIREWLTNELTEDPDYYLEQVYEDLKAKYRPQLRIDAETMQPVYDDTYKDALNAVLDRFYKYEDTYYDKE